MKTKEISKFFFRKAQYLTVDKEGRRIILEIDYWNNKFTILGDPSDEDVSKELSDIAKDLLKRKYKKNFAEK